MDVKKRIEHLPAQDIIDFCRSAVRVSEQLSEPNDSLDPRDQISREVRETLLDFLKQVPSLVKEDEKRLVAAELQKVPTKLLFTQMALSDAALMLTNLKL